MTKLQNTLLGLTILATMSACSLDANVKKPTKVSLSQYIDSNDLTRYGFTPERIKELNHRRDNNELFAKQHLSYNINGFTILINPDNPDSIYIIKDNQFIAAFNDQQRILYSKNVNIPAQKDVMVSYTPSDKTLSYNTGKYLYYDVGTDGIDITYEILANKDSHQDYLTAEILGAPNKTIIAANIANKSCKVLAGDLACCLADDHSYEAYQFTFNNGWQALPHQQKLTTICNSKDFEKEKIALQTILSQ